MSDGLERHDDQPAKDHLRRNALIRRPRIPRIHVDVDQERTGKAGYDRKFRKTSLVLLSRRSTRTRRLDALYRPRIKRQALHFSAIIRP